MTPPVFPSLRRRSPLTSRTTRALARHAAARLTRQLALVAGVVGALAMGRVAEGLSTPEPVPAGTARAVAWAPASRLQCAAAARWGDVNADTTVSILDAQQIARHSVGLSVANSAAVAARGDVTADGAVSILDAQQIARYSVGLSAAARINAVITALVTVTPASATLTVGSTTALAAVVRDGGGSNVSACTTVTYTSANPAVATVSAAGVVTGVAAGSTTITATAGSATATVAITVTAAPVATVALSPSSCTVDPGQACVPTATLRDAAGNALAGRTITWSSSASSVATVSASGTVTGVAAGTATVTATSEGQSATLAVTVANAAAATVVVTVDLAGAGSALADLLGVNRPPRVRNPPTVSGGATWDGTSLYAAFGISNVRTHDSGLDLCDSYTAATRLDMRQSPPLAVTACTMDASTSAPHYKWTPTSSADSALNNTANYDFADFDSVVTRIADGGGRVYLRLGDSFNGPNDTDDPEAWAKVLANMYAHLLGRFKASTVTADPVYVEIMNEPDGGFWRGTKSAFDTLYAQAARRVRAVAAAAGRSVVVGGPGFTAQYLTRQATPTNVAYRFGTSVGAANVDFLSVHHYNTCATATLGRVALFLRDTRTYADANGLAGKPLHMTEWNIGLGQECGSALYATQRTQSYASAVLTLMQHPAWQFQAAHFYAGMPLMALFDFGTAGKVKVNPSAWAFWAHRSLRNATSLPAEVCPGGTGCVAGTASYETPLLAVAGNAAGTRTLVLTNDGTSDVTYSLRLSGVSGSTATVSIVSPPREVQELSGSASPVVPSASQLTTLLASSTTDERGALAVSGGSVVLTGTIRANAVQVVRLP